MADDEVEQLLQAAQDEMLLKLSIDSHSSRSYPDYIDPDLHSRFLALKSQPSSVKKTTKKKQRPRSPPKSKDIDETPDDLMLRFAALKKSSLPSSSSDSPSVILPEKIREESADDDEIGEDAQVEKIIQWAIDAARLDPSPPSDDESESDDSTKCVKP